MDEVRALRICYTLLKRMDRRGQDAALKWLRDRLTSDEIDVSLERANLESKKSEFSAHVGGAALSLLALLNVSGASVARRSLEVRGPINADVMVHVRKAT